MTVQAANIMPTVPSYNVSQNVAKDFGCDFESFLGGSKDSVMKTENYDKNPVNKTENVRLNEKSAETLSDAEKTEGTEGASDKKPEVTETAKLSGEAEVIEDVETVTKDNQETEELQLPSEQLLAEILSILQEMVAVLQDELQVTEQQLLSAMDELQFQVTDFFDTEKLKSVFLQLNEVDATALLTDETLLMDLQQLQNLLDDVVEQSDLYSLLQQEGIEPEGFDLSMLETKITEQILSQQPVDAEVVADVSIEFESVKSFLQEAQQSDMTETNALEQLQTAELKSEVGYTGTSEQEHSFDAEQQFNQASMFLQKLANVTKSNASENVQSVTGSFDLIDIATQIIDQIRLQVRPDTTRMQIQLNPEHLGKVELEITSKNGELSARMNVQNDQVKEAVESQMQVLRETLEVQGIKVESIEVTVAEFGFRFQDEAGNGQAQQQGQNRRAQLKIDDVEEEKFDIPDAAEVMMELNGNSVDYVA